VFCSDKHKSNKEKNSNGQQFYQYQQNKQ